MMEREEGAKKTWREYKMAKSMLTCAILIHNTFKSHLSLLDKLVETLRMLSQRFVCAYQLKVVEYFETFPVFRALLKFFFGCWTFVKGIVQRKTYFASLDKLQLGLEVIKNGFVQFTSTPVCGVNCGLNFCIPMSPS